MPLLGIPESSGLGSFCVLGCACPRSCGIGTLQKQRSDHSPDGCGGLNAAAGLFFTSRQSGSGYADCGTGANDLFGCGTVGSYAKPSCAPYDSSSSNLCKALGSSWSCGGDQMKEANNVTKSSAAGGGALCCRDLPIE
jgi:hypothetical protein